ncbi:hypothetical protein SAMN05421848_0540 [Kushneria avicenniae]|uniref:Phosphatidylglycerophosphate synthase n=1 Tax=Kushneria avicenniae TaxID=402385 RepID=A0A1I1GEZ3_9GAMM|nr:hypothetical protein [Kushneria avicenniae]SFC09975.1 hypothetical protein SAMN05421848_0540 [Kushneria avicenniae]
MAWTAHQLVTWRISPTGLALAAIVLAAVTIPLLYAHQCLLAALAVALYRLLSVLSGWVSKALGHQDARQRYLRPFMEIVLILSVMGGLSLYRPERLFWPALALLVVTLIFDLERRVFALLQESRKITVRISRVGQVADIVTGSAGRTLLLMAACYWPVWFFWSGPGFAGLCLAVLIWRLIINYRRLASVSPITASEAATDSGSTASNDIEPDDASPDRPEHLR